VNGDRDGSTLCYECVVVQSTYVKEAAASPSVV
jgi:hypothetical protein